jgi:hypothetical protein
LLIYIPLMTQNRGSRYEVALGKLPFLNKSSVTTYRESAPFHWRVWNANSVRRHRIRSANSNKPSLLPSNCSCVAGGELPLKTNKASIPESRDVTPSAALAVSFLLLIHE